MSRLSAALLAAAFFSAITPNAQALLGEFMESLDMYKKPMVMSDQQINYFKKVLADHPDVRWTFVFLHQPDWDNPGDHKALKAIEAATGQAVYVCRGTPALNWS